MNEETARHIEKVREHLDNGDLRKAVAYINALTPHRFTGIYLFDEPDAHNALIVDKQDPDTDHLPDVPMTATYCSFTTPEAALQIRDSLADERFSEHPARKEVRSYCGMPMLDDRGEVFGTVCHFDFDVVELSEANVRLLEALGPSFRSRMSP